MGIDYENSINDLKTKVEELETQKKEFAQKISKCGKHLRSGFIFWIIGTLLTGLISSARAIPVLTGFFTVASLGCIVYAIFRIWQATGELLKIKNLIN